MKRHLIVPRGSLLAVAAVATAGVASGFGSQTSVRSFGHVKQMGPNMAGKKATSLAQLRGVNFVSGCRFSHRTATTHRLPGPARPVARPYVPRERFDERVSTLATCSRHTTSCRRPGDTAGYWVPTLIAAKDAVRSADGKRLLPAPHVRRAQDVSARPEDDRRRREGHRGPEPQRHLLELRPQTGVRSSSDDPDLPRRAVERAAAARRVPGLLGRTSLDCATTRATWRTRRAGGCPADHPVAVPAI